MMSNIWSKKKGLGSESDHEDEEDQGLRLIITTKLIVAKPDPKIIVKPIFVLNKIIQSISSSSNSATHDHHNHSYCYLKSCHLCHNHLSLDKEVYMYMGDMGFCSLECRDRQIYLDDVKEMEISTQKVLASFRRQRRRDGGGRCEDNNLFEELRQRRRHPFSSQKIRVIFS
ncbi:hypothetical protein BUALT_Bualt02G0126400 [Buddleja alternifolia]|uniref:FLZ-type domain-containing protein n=1 Tax=Buddleja alternifolia TaxID=168488 RepID=A0AAV6Y199_9LAMI|nr:hypothetical protein BUALT_Bualt02G0126400 [Buddleja alternifolia]